MPFYEQAAKQRQARKPVNFVPEKMPEQNGEAEARDTDRHWGKNARMLAGNDVVAAEQQFEECRTLFDELGDEWSEVLATLWLGNTLSLRGDSERAKELTSQAVVLARHQGDPWLLVVPLMDVGQEAFMRGELDKAESTLLEVESMLRAVGDQWTIGWPLTLLAQIHLMRADVPVAGRYISEALQLSRQYGNMMATIFSLVQTADALVLRYGPPSSDWNLRRSILTNAARLCGATQNFVDYPILLGSTTTRAMYDEALSQVRSRMEPEIWDTGFAEGATMSFEQALDVAATELQRIID